MGRKKKNTTETSKTSKAKKITDLSQTHGKSDEIEPTTLDQIWGDDGTSKYGTLNEEEYLNKLDGMTKSDIYLHASRLGIVPVDDRNRLRKTLVSGFRKHVAKFKMPTQSDESHQKLPKNIREILEEGK
tara:strand:- start:1838 stop:2224 length:387 start_codon:yes stop_codon:yes gene_type:complete